MNKYVFGLLAAIVLCAPVGLRACDCENPSESPVLWVHFKDGLTPNGPVDTSYSASSRGEGCTCDKDFQYRDYGPAHVAPAPEPVKRPSS
jgi:hypothetical protein